MKNFKLRTYEKAKEELDLLQSYIDLVDNYEVDDIHSFIIKYYSITNSASGVIKKAKNSDLFFSEEILTRELISEVIKSKPIDELHKVVRSGYIKRYGK